MDFKVGQTMVRFYVGREKPRYFRWLAPIHQSHSRLFRLGHPRFLFRSNVVTPGLDSRGERWRQIRSLGLLQALIFLAGTEMVFILEGVR